MIYYLALKEIEGPGVKLLDGPFMDVTGADARRNIYSAPEIVLVQVELVSDGIAAAIKKSEALRKHEDVVNQRAFAQYVRETAEPKLFSRPKAVVEMMEANRREAYPFDNEPKRYPPDGHFEESIKIEDPHQAAIDAARLRRELLDNPPFTLKND